AIKEFLAGYGFESAKAEGKMQEAEERARQWFGCAREIASAPPAQDFLALNDDERRKARDRGMQLEERHLQGTDPVQAQAAARAFGLADTPRGLLARKLSKYEIDFLTGGWLEVFFYGMLREHAADLGIWDVRLGLEVRPCGGASGNDLDVAFMHKYRLLTIE